MKYDSYKRLCFDMLAYMSKLHIIVARGTGKNEFAMGYNKLVARYLDLKHKDEQDKN